MKKVSLFSQVAGISSGIFLFLAVLPGISHAADLAYKFEIVDIPLHITFLGEPLDDIVRLTDIDNKGRMAGNDFAGEGFFVGIKHKAHEIRCPSDQTDNDSTTVSAINNLGKWWVHAPTADLYATETATSLFLIFRMPTAR